MSEPLPQPTAAYRPSWEIGEPLTDDEVREMGYEPTRRGWVPIPKWWSR